MRSIIQWSMQARVLIVVIAAALVFFGAREIEGAKVDTLPEFEPTVVEVQTEALGLSAHEVEQLITIPLEADLLAGVAWLDVIRSESLPGLSKIEMIFEPGTDVMLARQVVQERMTQAHALPHVSKPPQMLQPTSSTSRVLMVSLTSEQMSLIDMSVLARWTVKPRLLGVEGVANVSIYGNRDQQLQVLVDQARLKEKGVTLDDVLATTGNSLFVSPLTFIEASTPGTGGFIETPQQRLGVQHVQPLSTPEELAQIPIEGHPNVRLADVATLVEDHQPLIGDAVLKDGKPGLLLVVEKFPGTSTTEVTADVEEALDSLTPALPGIQVDSTVYRPATSIENSIDELTVAAGVAFVLIAVVLAAFFFGWRAALISAVSIPASLLVAGSLLGLTGNSVNIIIVAGLVMALLVIVDEAIVDIDNFMRRRRQLQAEGTAEAGDVSIIEAFHQMRAPMMTAMLIIFLSVMPLFFLNGVAGEFHPPMATAYILAVGGAMLVSLTLTPALAMFLLANAPVREDPPLVASVKRSYGTALSWFAQTRGAALIGALLVAAIGLVALTQLSEHSVLPDLEQREVLIQYDAAPGTSEGEMSRVVNAATQELQSIPGVETVGAHVGRAITSDEVVDVHSGENWVTIDSGADYGSTAAAIREVVDGYPGFSSSVGSYASERVNADLAGTGRDVTARVYGENQTILQEKANEVLAAISAVDGVEDARIEAPVQGPALEIEVDLEAAERYGIAPGDVRRTAAVLISGLNVGNLFEQQKIFDVVVWSTPDTRSSVDAIENLAIDAGDGSQVRLADVADVRIAPNIAVINRDQVSRYIDVTADTSGAGVKNDIERALAGIEFPQEHRVELIDNDGRLIVENRGLALAIAAAILMFLLLQLAFGSWRLAALAFVIVPCSLAGGAVAAFADGGNLTIGSYAGFLALLAISVRYGMALISGLQARVEQRGNPLELDDLLSGARDRVGPVLATAFATGLGLLPFLFITGGFGHQIVAPMAIVILGGLISSLVVTLFILPALYLEFAPGPQRALSPAQMAQQALSQEEASA
jgi:CzcA family heavy metal efflux pump